LKFVDVNCEDFDLYNVDFIPWYFGGEKKEKKLWWDSSQVNLGIFKFTTLYWQVCLALRKPLTNSLCWQIWFWSWKKHWRNQCIGSMFGLERKPL
jgi:hypothetical protein